MKSNKEAVKNEEAKKERMRTTYSELPNDEDSTPNTTPNKVSKKEGRSNSKEAKDSWGFRKSKSSKEKNDPERFAGDGINFKAKIIGIESVFNARGNRMCQDALQKLKAAVKTSGEHKQRILVNISLLGIRIKEEKTGEILHHHPVHKISFISQDVGDNRAFGYVYGCPQTGHQFFGIKTEKTAAQVVCTLRDLFHAALDMKKREMEAAIGNKEAEESQRSFAEMNGQTKTNGSSNCSGDMGSEQGSMTENVYSELTSLNGDASTAAKSKDSPTSESGFGCTVDNLLDLQFEMDSLQQGITQMEYSISSTASLGFGISFSEDDNSISSGCSYPMTPRKANRISSVYHETLSVSSRSSSTSDNATYGQDVRTENFATFKNDVPIVPPPPLPTTPPPVLKAPEPEVVEDRYAVFLDIDSIASSVFDNPISVPTAESDLTIDTLMGNLTINGSNSSGVCILDETTTSEEGKDPLAVGFAELDPLGNQPFVEKERFFSNIKHPPKKILKDLMGVSCDNAISSFESGRLASFGNVTDLSTVQESQFNPFVAPPASPPRLPPKRAFSIAVAPVQTSISTEESMAFSTKNPFNPFACTEEEIPETPPPTSPPPPPPRLPMRTIEPPVVATSPPPRPPSRDSAAPTPPRPRRKVPLASASGNWFSFDQDAISSHSSALASSTYADVPSSPPIPNPMRKRPTSSLAESLASHRSSSASNSPSMGRRYSNVQPRLVESAYAVNGSVSPGRRVLTRHTSVVQEPWGERPVDNTFASRHMFQDNFSVPSTKDCAEVKTILSQSPPLPPKSTGISRPRPSPSRKMLSAPCSSSQTSLSSSSMSASSSAQYSSLDETKSTVDSSSEPLYRSSGGESQVNNSSGYNGDMSGIDGCSGSTDSCQEGMLSPTSPDSIFRRKGDPFADDFFLSLPKKSTCKSSAKGSDGTECTNGFETDFESTKVYNCSEDVFPNKAM